MSGIFNTILDALTHGPGPIPTVTAFRLPTESSEPCSHSMKKLEFVEFPAFIPNSGPCLKGRNWGIPAKSEKRDQKFHFVRTRKVTA